MKTQTPTKNKPVVLTMEQKLATHFGVKVAEGGMAIKQIDADSRTIKAIANTYFFIDTDLDMLIPGCAKKSINERGPRSQADAKVKHQSDHELRTTKTVGRIDVLDEREIDGKQVLYFESYIPETRKGNDDLTNYQEGLFDNHSIGFRYKLLIFAEKDSENELSAAAWDEFYPKAINPDKADQFGFFWVVKEIELFEISVVSFGANELTPYLGSKSHEDGAEGKLKSEIYERLDNIAQLKSNATTKAGKKEFDLELLQLKQIIHDMKLLKPEKEATSKHETPTPGSTRSGESQKSLINNISKHF